MIVLRYVFFISVFLLLYLGLKDYYKIVQNKPQSSVVEPSAFQETKKDPEQKITKNFVNQIGKENSSTDKKIPRNFSYAKLLTDHFESQYNVSCDKPETKSVAVKQKSGVYRWKDAKGNWHFGDQDALRTENIKRSDDVSDQYLSKLKYFELTINNDGAPLSGFAEARIKTDTTQIFKVLSHFVEKEYIRQVALNLRFVKSPEAFNKRLKEFAPTIKTNTAFYSSLNNEAVIKLQKNQQTLFQIVRHESTHVVMAGLFGYPPTWFNEGVAEYFEQMQLSANSKKIVVNDYWFRLIKAKPMPLKNYLMIEGLAWRQQDQHQMYAYAWGLVYFLMGHEDGKRLVSKMLNKMAEQPCERLNSVEFIRRNYPMGFEGLNKNWSRWLEQGLKPHYY